MTKFRCVALAILLTAPAAVYALGDGTLRSCAIETACNSSQDCNLPRTFRLIEVGEVFDGGAGSVFLEHAGELKQLSLANQFSPAGSYTGYVVTDFVLKESPQQGHIRFFGKNHFAWVDMKVVDTDQGDLVWTDPALPSSLLTTILLGRCTVGWDE